MKSHKESLLKVAEMILQDLSAKCAGDAFDLERDLLTIKSRVEHEGLSFLTITLPSMGKDLEYSLSHDGISSSCFRSFKKHGKIPNFLRGYFRCVFNEEGGIIDEPDTESIKAIRQIAYSFKKLNVACASIKTTHALQRFVEDEKIFESQLPQDDVDYFIHVSHVLWDHVVAGVSLDTIIPKHGPGATAERLKPNEKFSFGNLWHERLERYFPLDLYMGVNASLYEPEAFQEVTLVSEVQEQPVRVVPVPKTLKGPRIIAIEPACMQYAQQAISLALVKRLEEHPLTAGHINFSDQSVNRKLAMVSSATGKYATLDLSAASDRVPCSVAAHMFDGNTDLRDSILACRSTRAQMPDGSIISLKKFASMGSALCFPVEAMYFYTLCVMALLRNRNLLPTLPNISLVGKDVYVYGDDILVPTNESAAVIETLHKYYCKVNTDKSFYHGNFRESCGMDAYAGVDVTPIYIRRVEPNDRRSHQELLSWVATSNLFYLAGYWKTAAHMLSVCEGILGELPIVHEACGGLGKLSFQNGAVGLSRFPYRRTNRSTHAFEVKTWVASPVYQEDPLDGLPALLKCLTRLELKDFKSDKECADNQYMAEVLSQSKLDVKHLARTARHGAVTLKRRWVQP